MFKSKPYIVAEVGSNWNAFTPSCGLDDCLRSIEVAKEVGADACKFQLFDFKSLYGIERRLVAVGTGEDLGEMRKDPSKGEMLDGWLPKLAAKCEEVGIDFACTAFSPELVRAVDPYVKWHKVASSDAAWPQLLEAVAKTGKPVLLSTGAKTQDDIAMAAKLLEIHGCPQVIGLYCVAAYPADYADLGGLKQFNGFSDHTLGYTATVEAARRGAVVIEKHFTAFPDLDTPDRPHSLTPAQFTRMVKLIRGEPVESEETAMFLRANRRLIATQDITASAVLKYGENYGAFRSLVDDTRGASPFDWEKVEGRMAKGEIKRGAAIALEDVE